MIKTQKERIDKGRQAFNDEIIRCSESDNTNEDNLKKKIESLEDEIKSLKDDNTKLSIYKKMYEPEVNKEFDILWEI